MDCTEFPGGISDKRGRHACYLSELCTLRTAHTPAQAHASSHTTCVFQERHNVICAHPKRVVILFSADRIVHNVRHVIVRLDQCMVIWRICTPPPACADDKSGQRACEKSRRQSQCCRRGHRHVETRTHF